MREETHVQHAVGLVENEKFDTGKVCVALLHEIDQSARRRNHEVNARAKRVDLWTLVHSAKDRGHAQRQMLRVGAHIFFDLHDEFTCRRHDQRLHAPAVSIARCARKFRQDGQDKRCCLAGACLRDTDNIAPGQHFGDGSRLYRGGFRVTSFLDGFENAVIKTERTKGHSPGTIGQYPDRDTRIFRT